MFQKSEHTQRLFDLLKTVNGHVAYGTLEASIGMPLAGFRSALSSARRALEKEEGIVFATERGIGLRRMSDVEKVQSTSQIREGIKRKAKRGLTRIGSAGPITALPVTEQITATINRTIFEAVKDATAHASNPFKAAPQPVPDLARLMGQQTPPQSA